MTNKSSRKLNVCYVLSYKSPNYTRTATLVAALLLLPNVELTVIKNRKTGVLRYWQTFTQLMKYRIHHKPDVYILGFRGQETFWLFYPFMRGSHIIFDEFINLHDWFVSEHHKLREGSLMVRLMDAYMRWVVRCSDYVLADTPAHARLSTIMYHAPTGKICDVPVGAEEEIFKPMKVIGKHEKFEVFFYGNMLPLHGMHVILDAIKQLAEMKLIEGMHFTLVGGKGKPEMMRQIEMFITVNSLQKYMTHLPWVNYEELPRYIVNADVCLGGPFGGTGQAMRVVTGKTYQFMAVGAPTIIGRTDNVGLFHDKYDSIVVEQNDPNALATALHWCHSHPKELKIIGRNGLKFYQDNFSISVIAQELNKFLD